MSNEEIIERVKAWQADPMKHELTCGTDSRHRPLIPVEKEGKVVLLCEDCGYLQNFIPEVVLHS